MTAQGLINLLEPLGYTIKRQRGSHTILKNPQFESIVVVPTGVAKELNQSTLVAIKKNVVEKGIIGDREFIEAVETIERDEVPVVSKTANVVEEVALGKPIMDKTDIIRDTIRNTNVDTDDVRSSNSTDSSFYREHHRC